MRHDIQEFNKLGLNKGTIIHIILNQNKTMSLQALNNSNQSINGLTGNLYLLNKQNISLLSIKINEKEVMINNENININETIEEITLTIESSYFDVTYLFLLKLI